MSCVSYFSVLSQALFCDHYTKNYSNECVRVLQTILQSFCGCEMFDLISTFYRFLKSTQKILFFFPNRQKCLHRLGTVCSFFPVWISFSCCFYNMTNLLSYFDKFVCTLHCYSNHVTSTL